MTMRWNSTLRQLVPTKVNNLIKRSRLQVKYRSTSVNVYHCCVHKTGSPWIKAILSDSRTLRYSGLMTYSYQSRLPGGYDPRNIVDRTFNVPFSKNTIVSPLYIDFENYENIPKPKYHKTFFVMRDPRDITISWYFSSRYSHPLMGKLSEIREVLTNVSLADGILYSIEILHDNGLFAALHSWADAPKKDQNVLLLRFEEITTPDNFKVFKKLFSHCDIHMPEKMIYQLLEDHRFERLTKRKQGEENMSAHLRKGISGDWKNYFDNKIVAKFKNFTGDLVTRAGYENNLNR